MIKMMDLLRLASRLQQQLGRLVGDGRGDDVRHVAIIALSRDTKFRVTIEAPTAAR